MNEAIHKKLQETYAELRLSNILRSKMKYNELKNFEDEVCHYLVRRGFLKYLDHFDQLAMEALQNGEYTVNIEGIGIFRNILKTLEKTFEGNNSSIGNDFVKEWMSNEKNIDDICDRAHHQIMHKIAETNKDKYVLDWCTSVRARFLLVLKDQPADGEPDGAGLTS